MSGAIMPEPLAKPLMRTVAPSIVAVAVAPFGKVSVVMIARAAASQRLGGRAAAQPRAGRRRSSPARGGSPITPVEEMNTSRGSQPISCAAVAAVASTTCQPARPVKTLELPELTTIARTLPPGRHSRHQITGWPGIVDLREHAGDRAARRQLRQHQIVAPAVSHPGGVGGEPHAGNRLQRRESARARGARQRSSILISKETGIATSCILEAAAVNKAAAPGSFPPCSTRGCGYCPREVRFRRIDTPAAAAYLSIVAVRSFSRHRIHSSRFPCSAP